jgi:hypothetical protein
MSTSKLNVKNAINEILKAIYNNHPLASRLKTLNNELETIYEVYGFSQFRRMVLQFLYTLLVNQKPIGYSQPWEIPALAHSIARMPCMQHIYFRNDIWQSLRNDLETFLDRAFDGELRLASEEDFLDELGSELNSAKRAFYESCRQKCNVYRQDLVATVMHPDRIEKILNKHGFEMIESLFGY